ncbi:MAG: DUF3047 domain-containing protein [Balneolaceae bacterium]|nr:DUF3047 domain-containing protein [Balneolaceae bacterium]MBO6547784.1 DUF3047 domain-containing protein [Balneolaceae bacterium]MBO6648295.1 DUF3047 domain-containing protein [Balneolaceae bacterium]
MINLKLALHALLLFIFAFKFPVTAQETIKVPVTDFNPESLTGEEVESPRWSVLKLPNRDATKYTLVESDDRLAIKAESMNSASGLVYKVDIDPEEFPIIEWSWKVKEVLKDGNYATKKGDDYPARIYITFDYDKSNLKLGDRIKYSFIKTFTSYPIPLRAINYIWANKAEKETIAPNAYTDWVYMVAVRTGNGDSGDWVTEVRNIYEDYKKAFGEAPPRISGVAIMSDSDNTKGASEAYYGDIEFRKNMD